MTAPQRLRLSRKKGYRLPADAVNVARPTRWGNPYKVTASVGGWDVNAPTGQLCARADDREGAAVIAVTLYRQALLGGRLPFTVADVRSELAGRSLACWCPAGSACHATVLLAVANTKRAGVAP